MPSPGLNLIEITDPADPRLDLYMNLKDAWLRVRRDEPTRDAELGRFIAACDESSLYVNLYVGSTVKLPRKSGAVTLKMQTRYPWDGRVVMLVEPAAGQQAFDLCLRIPGWSRDAKTPGDLYRTVPGGENAAPTLKINGKPVAIGKLDKGYCRITRRWSILMRNYS